ncbi:hypothetical protein L6164_021831 [Bauhinia variegata]|uniref:Uncharacterized protein n=1 Tax=Bauhinia variegata TaxID=167791 RepID=A0ACB9MG48_BAUVA|nr:hypothetical protein L6164_021831 [Bauhinia variegata]
MEGDDQAAPEAGTDIEQGEGAAISQGRSYECTFCKRGFSNAQALGGHMNIHRKDKAKLKQSPNEAKPAAPAQDRSNLNWPRNASSTSGDRTNLVDIRQLPLFAETPYSCEPQKPSDHDQLIHGESTEKVSSSTHDSSMDLDLELRLGPEPQDSPQAPSMGTRKFF